MKPLPALLVLALALASTLGAQASRPTPDEPRSLAEDYANLRQALERLDSADGAAVDTADPDPTSAGTPRDRRLELLRAFLDRYADGEPARREVLAARCQLAALHLTSFESTHAAQQYAAVLEHAPSTALDARGLALFGLAQAAELAGDEAAARTHLRVLLDDADLRGSRYARFARIAHTRLENSEAVQVGSHAPDFGSRLDLDGKSRTVRDLRGGPALIVFFSPLDEPSLATVQNLLDVAARTPTVENDNVLLFALQGSRERVLALREQREWTCPIVASDGEFIDAAALQFAVERLPTAFLLGADGTVLARDPTARRLREALARLR